MGASKSWLKSIVSKKKSHEANDADNESTTVKKASRWSLLKSSHVIDKGSIVGGRNGDKKENIGRVSGSRRTKVSRSFVSQADQAEWAAVCIQTAFRGYLARRALCALKGLKRLKATITGQNTHNQSLGCLRSIQTFVRMQAQIHVHRALRTEGGATIAQKISNHTAVPRPIETEEGWCDAVGTVEEIQARAQQRQEAAIKRERAMAYAFSNQWRANSKLNLESLFDYELDNSRWSWIWLERCRSIPPATDHSLYSKAVVGDSETGITPNQLSSVATKKSDKSSIDPLKGNHSELPRAKSHGAGSGLPLSPGNKTHGNRQGPRANTEKWRSLSNPKQRPSKDVRRRESLPSLGRMVPHQGGKKVNGMGVLEGMIEKTVP